MPLRHTCLHSHNTTEQYTTLHNTTLIQHYCYTNYMIIEEVKSIITLYHQTRLRRKISTHLSIHRVGNYNKHVHDNTYQSQHKQMSEHLVNQRIRQGLQQEPDMHAQLPHTQYILLHTIFTVEPALPERLLHPNTI